MIRVTLAAIFCFTLNTVSALDDPMRPPFLQESTDGQQIERRPIKLSMILEKSDATYAVVNGKTVARGDSVDGYTVVRVNEDSVSLRRQGKIYKAKLFKSAEKSRLKIIRRRQDNNAGESDE